MTADRPPASGEPSTEPDFLHIAGITERQRMLLAQNGYRILGIEAEARAIPPALDAADWHEFVDLVYRLIPDGDVRGPIIGAAARLSASGESDHV